MDHLLTLSFSKGSLKSFHSGRAVELEIWWQAKMRCSNETVRRSYQRRDTASTTEQLRKKEQAAEKEQISLDDGDQWMTEE